METPGTAPGSATLIPRTVYRHSHRGDGGYIAQPLPAYEGGRIAEAMEAPQWH